MKLELKDMKISKVEVCKPSDQFDSDVSYGLRTDENILNPTTFALIIKRNLSSSWYKEIPELDISGRLKSIVVSIFSKQSLSEYTKSLYFLIDQLTKQRLPAIDVNFIQKYDRGIERTCHRC